MSTIDNSLPSPPPPPNWRAWLKLNPKTIRWLHRTGRIAAAIASILGVPIAIIKIYMELQGSSR